MIWTLIIFFLGVGPAQATSNEVIQLYPGFITKVRCEGRLLVSAVGNDNAVRIEALPKELGCGVLLKPIGTAAKTNLILETTTGTIRRIVTIAGPEVAPRNAGLEYRLKGDVE